MEKSIPGFISSASQIAEIHRIPKDTVLFRQGDPPACLYIIIQGEVGVFINGPQRRPRTPVFSETNLMKLQKSWKNLVRTMLAEWGWMERDERLERKLEIEREMQRLYTHHSTYEGFSECAEGSTIGKKVVTLGPGKCFGDQAMKNDDPRNATIKLLTDCELLRVHKEDFDVKLCDKVCHFKNNVAGFHDYEHMGTPQEHPSTVFKDCTFKKGHEFFEEGTLSEAMIVVVRRGTVAFRRRNRTNVGVRGTKEYRTWMSMSDGDVFCSLGMLGLGNVEPFSAVVTSDLFICYMLTGRETLDFQEVPREILDTLIDRVTEKMRRLLNLSNAFAGVDSLPEGVPQSWGGVMGEVSLAKRCMSRRTLRCMRDYACKDRSWGKSSSPRGAAKYRVAPEDTSTQQED